MQPKALIVVSEDWYFLSHRLPLAKRLKAEGYDVALACRFSDKRKEIENHGVRCLSVDFQRDGISPLKALKTVSALRAIYKQERPDLVVHVALFTVLLGTIAAIFSPAKKVLNLVTGLGFSFISNSLKARIIRTVVSVAFWGFARTKKVNMLVQNRDDLALMSGFGFSEDHNLFLVRGSGVDAVHFHPAPALPQPPLITFVGRLLWAKGVGEIIEAARLLKERGQDIRIALVGDIDALNPQSATQDDLASWQADGLVECWGRRTDIADIYRQSTVALLPSWREGLPKSLLEAAACGLAMIATDVPGCREIVRDQENGLLVPLQNSVALANAIECLAKNPALCAEFGAAARRFVDEELNDQAIMDKTMSVIHQITA
ncbi:glycosyltransferase family 4 protein [Terasakiella sp.]|uniref:glycosyltransferase family 4 protein n=1 Tax=Terasakiella sp. TaxID=2034861 RepID=UPI003AA93C9C